MMNVPGLAKDETIYCWDPHSKFNYSEINLNKSDHTNLSNRCESEYYLSLKERTGRPLTYEITKSIYDKIENVRSERRDLYHRTFESGELKVNSFKSLSLIVVTHRHEMLKNFKKVFELRESKLFLKNI